MMIHIMLNHVIAHIQYNSTDIIESNTGNADYDFTGDCLFPEECNEAKQPSLNLINTSKQPSQLNIKSDHKVFFLCHTTESTSQLQWFIPVDYL